LNIYYLHDCKIFSHEQILSPFLSFRFTIFFIGFKFLLYIQATWVRLWYGRAFEALIIGFLKDDE